MKNSFIFTEDDKFKPITTTKQSIYMLRLMRGGIKGCRQYEKTEEDKMMHHPKWVKYCVPRDGEQHYQCTKCKEYFNFGQYGDYYTKAFKYCPNCGSRMEA